MALQAVPARWGGYGCVYASNVRVRAVALGSVVISEVTALNHAFRRLTVDAKETVMASPRLDPAFYEADFRSRPEPAAVVARDGSMVACNDSFAARFDWAAVSSVPFSELFDADAQTDARHQLEAASSGAPCGELILRYRGRDGATKRGRLALRSIDQGGERLVSATIYDPAGVGDDVARASSVAVTGGLARLRHNLANSLLGMSLLVGTDEEHTALSPDLRERLSLVREELHRVRDLLDALTP